VRREFVLHAVARKERDARPADGADRDRRRRRPVRRLDADLLDVFQERVEPRAAEDSGLRRGHGAQAIGVVA
jgi:hypothetical protein